MTYLSSLPRRFLSILWAALVLALHPVGASGATTLTVVYTGSNNGYLQPCG